MKYSEFKKTPIQERKDEKKYLVNPLYAGDETKVFTGAEAREICYCFGWDFREVAVEVDGDE